MRGIRLIFRDFTFAREATAGLLNFESFSGANFLNLDVFGEMDFLNFSVLRSEFKFMRCLRSSF